SRIVFRGNAPREKYMEFFHEVDIALDPFPLNGGTTTCDALWMGVPVVTLAGDRFISRLGVSLLGAAGLAHWVARSQSEYIELAQAWSMNLTGLARLRQEMRRRIR